MKKSDAVNIKIVVSVGKSTREYSLGHEAIKNLIWSTGELQVDEFFWSALAGHPSAEIRAGAAGSSDFAGNLQDFLEDPSVEVRAAAIEGNPEELLGCMDSAVLNNLIKTDDIKIVKAIADNLRWVHDEDALAEAMELLGKHPDPAIRLCVANDDRTDKKRLKALSKDADLDVAKAAQRSDIPAV